MKVLRAVRLDLCQADEGELLMPNPMVVPEQDNDFFIGIQSRRPARYGRVSELEDATPDVLIQRDHAAVTGGDTPADADDEERAEDIQYLLDVLSDFEAGALVGCRYTIEDDELSWEILELDEDTLTEL